MPSTPTLAIFTKQLFLNPLFFGLYFFQRRNEPKTMKVVAEKFSESRNSCSVRVATHRSRKSVGNAKPGTYIQYLLSKKSQPWLDGSNTSGWYGRLRGPISTRTLSLWLCSTIIQTSCGTPWVLRMKEPWVVAGVLSGVGPSTSAGSTN